MKTIADNQATGESAGGWSADDYAQNARFVADLAASLVDWLVPVAGERILDLGCGDGALTEKLVARDASVLGVDASPDLVAAARARALDAIIGDGQSLDTVLEGQPAVDAVFSNAALHWMARDPDAVIAGVFAQLRPGGRFVAEFGAQGNVHTIREALRAEASARGQNADALDPWFFPTEKQYLKQLVDAGFSIQRHECFARPTSLPSDITGWLETLARPFVHAFDEGESRRAFVGAVRERLAPALQNADGSWTADYVRLRFVAIKPDAAV